MAFANNQPGTICWLEIPVISVPRAAAFYTAVLGWECNDPRTASSVSGLYYQPLFRTRSRASSSDGDKMTGTEGPAGAGVAPADNTAHEGMFIQVPENNPFSPWDGTSPHRPAVVLTYFAVESIEATLESVEKMGGSTHQ